MWKEVVAVSAYLKATPQHFPEYTEEPHANSHCIRFPHREFCRSCSKQKLWNLRSTYCYGTALHTRPLRGNSSIDVT